MSQRVHVLNDVWDVDTLAWGRMRQPTLSTDTVAVTLAGAATAANQTTNNTALSNILTELQGKADLAETQPVSAASLPLPTGAATQATLANLLTELQAKADVSETQPISIVGTNSLIEISGQVNGQGNNTLVTPTSGKKLQMYYVAYNPLLAVEAAFRFGAAGQLFLRNNVTANSVVAKDFGASRHLEGAIDEPLILNLSLGVAVNWNAFYKEI